MEFRNFTGKPSQGKSSKTILFHRINFLGHINFNTTGTMENNPQPYLSVPLYGFSCSSWYLQGGGTPIYPVLRSSFSVKSQAKNLQLVKGQRWFVIVYHNRYFQNISVNVKLQKYTRIRSKVKCNF